MDVEDVVMPNDLCVLNCVIMSSSQHCLHVGILFLAPERNQTPCTRDQRSHHGAVCTSDVCL